MPEPQHCVECNDLFEEVRDAGLAIAKYPPATPGIAKARVGYLSIAAVYRLHKNQCPVRGRRAA
jgi:hypothetical protein